MFVFYSSSLSSYVATSFVTSLRLLKGAHQEWPPSKVVLRQSAESCMGSVPGNVRQNKGQPKL